MDQDLDTDQIRVRWRHDIPHSEAEAQALHWRRDTAATRRMLGAIVEAGNARHGVRSHWIEERQGRVTQFGTPDFDLI